jgi:hypothetical protein
MSRLLTIAILILFPIFTEAQKPLDYGHVINDSSFNCNTSNVPNSQIFGLNSICDSRNEFELRLYIFALPAGNRHVIILGYDGIYWNLKKITRTGGAFGPTLIEKKMTIDTFSSVQKIFSNVFDSLKTNGLFQLPNATKLKYDQSIMDGVKFYLTYKANKNFRTYSFDNPRSYYEYNKEIIEFKQYDLITTILYNLAE